MIWIFTEGEGDGIKSRLDLKVFSTLYNISKHKSDLPSWWSSSSTDILVGIIPSVVNMKGAKVSTNFIQHSEQKQNLVIRLLQNHCKSLWKFCTILQFWRTFWETHKIWKKNLPHGFHKSADLLSKRQNHEEDFFKLCVLLKKSEL